MLEHSLEDLLVSPMKSWEYWKHLAYMISISLVLFTLTVYQA